MGFYIRKSFRAGPVRFNLSKSGFGASAGVKGLRLGTSGSGRNYVHAGRGGLYYRKTLGTKQKTPAAAGIGLGYAILFIISLFIIAVAVIWMIQNPILPITLGVFFMITGTIYLQKKSIKTKIFSNYKNELDKHFLLSEVLPDENNLTEIKELKKKASNYKDLLPKLDEAERKIYTAILDKILDDKIITNNERRLIKHFETIASLDENFKLETKKEIFRLYYLDIIADHEITNEEQRTLNNIISGLELPQTVIRDELQVVQEIIKMQQLLPPLTPIENTPVKLQKSETPYYTGDGKILSRKKAKKSSRQDYEYSVRRDGKLVVTDKRVLVSGEGTSTVNLKDILDIDVDLDNSMLIISKDKSSTPTFIQAKEPLYSAKIIDILTEEIK